MNPLIACHRLDKYVNTPEGKLTILKNISLSIQPGESVAVMGPSGSGKSTLLGLLAGLDQASDGEIYLMGQPLHQLDEEARVKLRLAQVGFVFQSFQLLPNLTALENVMLPLELAGITHAKEKAQHWLEEVSLKPRLHHTPRTLSGGEQQRVAIARAFACEPKVIFADEPTGNLDTHTGEHIIDLILRYQTSHAALMLVTHDEALAKRCQRRIYLNAGEIEGT